jgi:uncharacterized protein
MNSTLYVGTIAHQRHIPKPHKFRYPFFMWFLNLDELDRLPPLGRWFAVRQWALYRYHRSDYLGNPEQSLADAVRQRMRELTGHQVGGIVCGLMNVRTLGLYFSPVNFYYGFDEQGNFSHFLAEVSNTPWNERYQYGHYVGDGNLAPTNPKAFQVSPFNPLDQHYSWRLEAPGESIQVGLDVHDRRGHIFEASLQLRRCPLTLRTVRRQLVKKPVMTACILAGIYCQALKIFLKGIPYIPYKNEMI